MMVTNYRKQVRRFIHRLRVHLAVFLVKRDHRDDREPYPRTVKAVDYVYF